MLYKQSLLLLTSIQLWSHQFFSQIFEGPTIMVSNSNLPSGITCKSLNMYSANTTQYLVNSLPDALITTISLTDALVHNASFSSIDTSRQPAEALCFGTMFHNYVQSVKAMNHMVRKVNATKHLCRIDQNYIEEVWDDEVETPLLDVSSFMNIAPIMVCQRWSIPPLTYPCSSGVASHQSRRHRCCWHHPVVPRPALGLSIAMEHGMQHGSHIHCWPKSAQVITHWLPLHGTDLPVR